MNKIFTKHFNINPKQKEFVDIPLEKDIKLFACPFLIENNKDIEFIQKVSPRLRAYLTELNEKYVKPNNRHQGIQFLNKLHEPNEYHLGYSIRNRGSAVGFERAELIFDSLRSNPLSSQIYLTILNEAHNILILVKGIGPDIISDITLNVCRDIFADFTYKTCLKYEIPTFKHIIEFYDSDVNMWVKKDVQLPEYLGKKIILLPRTIVCKDRAYPTYYNYFVATHHVKEEVLQSDPNDTLRKKLVHIDKEGNDIISNKEIFEYNRKPKGELFDFVKKYPSSLNEFIDYAKDHYSEIGLDALISKLKTLDN